jgi:fatty acid desaturase
VSIVVGCFVSAMALFLAMGYGISHWNHHRFTNQASDPDVLIYPRLRTFWSRLFLARVLAQRGYTRAIVALATGRALPFAYRFPFPTRAQQRLAVWNIAFLLFWLAVYAAIAIRAPFTALLAIGLPLILVVPFSGLRIYVEHAGTGTGAFRDSRSYVSPVYTAMFFGNNYHLEHHLYPTVPCYHLPAVHRFLRNHGYHDRWGSPVDPTVSGPLVHTTSASSYPGPLGAGADLPDDPFREPRIPGG